MLVGRTLHPALLRQITEALAVHGLIPRGGFAFKAGEAAPDGPSGKPARFVLLVGHGGGTLWPHFSAWRETQPADLKNPLDTWSRSVIGAVANTTSARAVFPSDRPYLPFQQWAMRAEGLKPSPLGILMHPQFGLWHAYRGALLFDTDIAAPAPANPIHLCDTCAGKNCMNACPAQAVSEEGLDAAKCGNWLRSEAGGTCRENGCIARAACPHGSHRYSDEQTAFHMAAHLRGLFAGK